MKSGNKTAAITHRGEVIWFNDSKGIGFIKPADGSPDVFVHFSGIATMMARKTLQPQQRVEFEMSDGPKGPFAINVRVVT